MSRRAAVLGSPVAHSLSPLLHAAAHRELGLDGWGYERVEMSADGLAAFLDSLGPEWVGLSLTMPLKQTVLPLLDDVSPLARAVGAVNTVTFGPADDDGRRRRRGDNTDVAGIVGALGEGGVHQVAEGATAVVLGAGATAASAVAALAELGCREPVVVVRSRQRADGVVEAAGRVGVRARLADWDDTAVADLLRHAAVAVATTPAGAADGLAAVLASSAGGGERWAGVLLDVVYDPWPTALARAWQAGGGRVVDGVEMLVHQARDQVRLWTGRTPSLSAMRAAVDGVR